MEIFSAIRMREKYYCLSDCLDGLCSAGYNGFSMGGRIVFSCFNPIPPVAMAAGLPAEHVLSRLAGAKKPELFQRQRQKQRSHTEKDGQTRPGTGRSNKGRDGATASQKPFSAQLQTGNFLGP